eukprot:TRINITY_DN23460_c0_g2_i1.p1 TRINITY_DN23460_c0_g2~~TRINITY_DN23460_c0_g2_i1.p1  ORF type:complete len:778 (-),score=161.41 TRINITY_DN23460_c0_g2_i1:57-2390(-)
MALARPTAMVAAGRPPLGRLRLFLTVAAAAIVPFRREPSAALAVAAMASAVATGEAFGGLGSGPGFGGNMCWADGLGYSYEWCCLPFAVGGRPECWTPPRYTFERCCVPRPATTATDPRFRLLVPRTPATERAAMELDESRLLDTDAPDTYLEVTDEWCIGCAPSEPAGAAMASTSSPLLSIVWRQGWSCPPSSAATAALGAVPPRGAASAGDAPPDGCAHEALGNQETSWTYSRTSTELFLEYAHSAAGGGRPTLLAAAGLRLGDALAEAWCLLRWWRCFDGHELQQQLRLDQLCAVIELTFHQLALAGGEDLHLLRDAFLVKDARGRKAMCSVASGQPNKLFGLVLEASRHVFAVIERDLAAHGTKRWSHRMYSNPATGRPLIDNGIRQDVLYHFAAPPEFSPACDGLALRPRGTHFFAGPGGRPWVDSTLSLTWHLPFDELMRTLRQHAGAQKPGGEAASWVVVNLGAEDGGCHQASDKYWMLDPANCLLEGDARWGGILLEGNPASSQALRARYRQRDGVLCVQGLASPGTVRDLLLSATPCGGDSPGPVARSVMEKASNGQVDLLKLDLDFGDCDFLEVLVPWLKPKVVHVEVNPHFPPPYALRQRFDETAASVDPQPVEWRSIRGCSLSGVAQALGPDYALAQLEFDHALFVRRALAERALPLWRSASKLSLWDHWLAGYHCHPLKRVTREDGSLEPSFDFRSFVPWGAVGTESAEASMRAWIAKCGGLLQGAEASGRDAGDRGGAARAAGGGVDGLPPLPVTLERCEACG